MWAVRTRIAQSEHSPYYGWIIVAVCFLTATVTFGTIYSFSVFFEFFLQEFGTSNANTSLVFSLQSVVLYVGGAVLGGFIDQYGRRRLILVAIGLVSLGLVGTSTATSILGVVVAYSIVGATGMGVLYVVSYATIPRWFQRRQGIANGIATAGTGAGIMFGPPAASFLIDAYGWRDAYLGLLGVVVAGLAVTVLLVADGPRSLGVDASAEFPEGAPEQTQGGFVRQLADTRDVVLSSRFGLVFLALVLCFVPMFVVLVHFVSYTASSGIGRWVGVLGLSVAGGVSIPGRLLGGTVSDRVGYLPAFASANVLMSVATVLFTVFSPPPVLLALVVVFAIGQGTVGALLSPVLVELFGSKNLSSLFGLATISLAIAGAVGPYVGGLTYDLTATYEPTFVDAGLTGLSGVLLFVLAIRVLW